MSINMNLKNNIYINNIVIFAQMQYPIDRNSH